VRNPLLYVEMTFFRSNFCDNLPPKNHCTLTVDQGFKKNCDINLFSKNSNFVFAKIVEITRE
jgi:hypothetical protein